MSNVEKITTLFIGGPCDGMRIKVHTDMGRATVERLSAR